MIIPSRARALLLRLGTACALLTLVAFAGTPVQAQDHPGSRIDLRKVDLNTVRPIDPGLLPPIEETCGLTATAFEGTSVTQSLNRSSKTAKQTATFVVDYGPGFDTQPGARQAFQRAVDTWATHIESDVPIRIEAQFGDLGGNILGGARPDYVLGEVDGETLVIAVNLLEAVKGQRYETMNPASTRTDDNAEIFAIFNSSRTDWNFDESPASANEIDFETVVLHEIGHGLQFTSTFEYNDGSSGDTDCNGQANTACYGFGTGQFSTFDRGTVLYESDTESQTPLLDIPNNSAEMADAVQTNFAEFQTEQVRFAGPRATVSGGIDNGPQPPILYFPGTWRDGSSGSHVDESTYPPSSADALMTPSFGFGETTRLPGPVVCGMLDDMGWPLGSECLRYLRDPIAFQLTSQDADLGRAQFEWIVGEATEVESYTVQRQYFDGPFEVLATLDGTSDPAFTDTNLGLGRYTYRLDFTRPDGSTGTVDEQPSLTIEITDVEARVRSDDSESPQSEIRVEWDVPPATEGFTYFVERRRGSGDRNPFDVVTQTSNTQFVDQNLFPGVYGYRIRAVTTGQNEVSSITAETEISANGEVFISGPNPNPVVQGRSQATLSVTSRAGQDATVAVYNTLGQQVYSLDIPLRRDAATPIAIPTRELSSGMYFVQIRAEEFSTTRQMAVTR